MKHEMYNMMDNLFSELVRLQKNQIDGRSLTPTIICQYQEKLIEKIVKECEVALKPMLRDMISRGQAYNLIKDHFGVES